MTKAKIVLYVINKHYVGDPDNTPSDYFKFYKAFADRKEAMAVAKKLDKKSRIYFYLVKRIST
jgi:hypothetical protein